MPDPSRKISHVTSEAGAWPMTGREEGPLTWSLRAVRRIVGTVEGSVDCSPATKVSARALREVRPRARRGSRGGCTGDARSQWHSMARSFMGRSRTGQITAGSPSPRLSVSQSNHISSSHPGLIRRLSQSAPSITSKHSQRALKTLATSSRQMNTHTGRVCSHHLPTALVISLGPLNLDF